jgi:hypothetical protein
MTTKELRKQLQLFWSVYIILIPLFGLLAFLMNNIDGLRLIPYILDGQQIRIYVLIAFALISIPLGYFISFKKINSLKKEDDFLIKENIYRGSYIIRMAFIGGNALFCIVTYYGLNLTEILIGLPIYLLILLVDRPASEDKLDQILNRK